tara:strand:- start:413 stop:793 length:381 start_codon:yes stop_codon:yes gene_type:complete
MDEVFSVLPPNATERKEIIRIHLAKRKQKMIVRGLDALIAASKGYVGAEIEAAIKEACVDAYVQGARVNGKTVMAQLACMKPISIAFKEDFDRMKKWAQNNARPSSPVDPDESPTPRKVRRGRMID